MQVWVDTLERFWNKSGESRTYRLHTQTFHTVQYLVLQRYLLAMPIFVKRTVYATHISHTHPRQMGGTDKIAVYLFIGQTHLLPYTGDNSFIAYQCQGHIYAMQRHPVNLLFPAFPVPVGHGITIRANIEHIMMSKRRDYLLLRTVYQLLRKTNVIARPTVKPSTVALHEIIESSTQSHRTTSLYLQHAMVYPILESRFTLKFPFIRFQH